MIIGLRPEPEKEILVTSEVPLWDVSGTSFQQGVTNFTEDNLVNALVHCNLLDVDPALLTMRTHPALLCRIRKNNLVDYLPMGTPTFRGLTIQEDGNMPLRQGLTCVRLEKAGKPVGLLKVREH